MSELVHRRTFRAPVDLVWRCLTEPAELAQFWGPAGMITPVDGISAWKAAGSPTWDPITFTAKRDGQSLGIFPGATGATTIPVVFTNLASQNASLIFGRPD